MKADMSDRHCDVYQKKRSKKRRGGRVKKKGERENKWKASPFCDIHREKSIIEFCCNTIPFSCLLLTNQRLRYFMPSIRRPLKQNGAQKTNMLDSISPSHASSEYYFFLSSLVIYLNEDYSPESFSYHISCIRVWTECICCSFSLLAKSNNYIRIYIISRLDCLYGTNIFFLLHTLFPYSNWEPCNSWPW